MWQTPDVPWEHILSAAAIFTIGWIVVFFLGLTLLNIEVWHICVGLPLIGWVFLIVAVIKATI
ncbi:MAG: hypothetical protein AMJ53_16725 [Gammaproteobacteria bacterium SG8_11]|nr:MAG: hypothetical protein AMJ53_16725 [Gammaproteobacteria bacterium SG8_11]